MYMLNAPEKALVVAKRGSPAQAREVMKQIAGKGWTMERRPDIHTFGDLVLTMRPIFR